MRPIVQLHDETHWREAVMIDGKWHVAVDGVMQPATRLFVKSWSYLQVSADAAAEERVNEWKPLFKVDMGVAKAGAA